MAKQAKLKENYVIKCAHCMTDDFELRDVDLYGEAREYTDTPRRNRRRKLEETPQTTQFEVY